MKTEPLERAVGCIHMAKSLRHQYAAMSSKNADWTVVYWPITAHAGDPDGPTALLGDHLLLRDANELVYKHINANA